MRFFSLQSIARVRRYRLCNVFKCLKRLWLRISVSTLFMNILEKATAIFVPMFKIQASCITMVTETNHKVKQPITDLYNGDHIEDMTKKWLCQTPHPPQIPEFFPTFVTFSTCCMQKCGKGDWLKWEKAHEERFITRKEFWSMVLLG